MTSPIDDLDARLIALMADEPRIGLMEASRRLNVARGTVQARLAKLTDRGVIRSFGPEIDPSKIGYPVLAFVFLEITQGRLIEAIAHLESVPEVLEAHATSGPRDLLCRVAAHDTEQLQEIIKRTGRATLLIANAENQYEYVFMQAALESASEDDGQAVIDALSEKYEGRPYPPL